MFTPVFIPATGAFEITSNLGFPLSLILYNDFGWTGGAPVVIFKANQGPFTNAPGIEIDIPGARVIIESGVVIAGGSGFGAGGPSDPGIHITAPCYVENNGTITGGGGQGGWGNQGAPSGNGYNGAAGVYATATATVLNNGTIQGGGGGGGAGVFAKNYAGGGGGAGFGTGGINTSTGVSGKGLAGSVGGLSTGGAGGDDLIGGTGALNKGGAPAMPGLGGGSNYTAPGNGGAGIQGISYITLTNNGTITGSQI